MTTVINYISDDGKIFTTEEECLNHENQLKAKKYEKVIKLYDDNGTILDLQKIIKIGLEDVVFIKCVTDYSAKFLYDIFCDSYELPWSYRGGIKAGVWKWEEPTLSWIPISQYIEEMKIINKVIND